MNNVSVGDIFTNSDDIYRVVALHHREEFPDDLYIKAEVFVSGSGFKKEDNYSVASCVFTLTEAVKYKLQHYKLVNN